MRRLTPTDGRGTLPPIEDGIGQAREDLDRVLQGGDPLDLARLAMVRAADGRISPLADMAAIAATLVPASAAGPEAAMILVPELGRLGDRVTASAEAIAWASWASHLLVPVESRDDAAWAIVPAESADLTPVSDVSATPRHDVVLLDAEPVAVITVAGDAASLLQEACSHAALVRAAQKAIALASVLEAAIDHVRTREQFGAPLGRIGAVQQLLSLLAAEVATARAVAPGLPVGAPSATAAAIAALRTDRAARKGLRYAHQLFGATGTARDHTMGRLSVAIESWTGEFGSRSSWSRTLVEFASTGDPWERIVALGPAEPASATSNGVFT